MDSSEEKQSNYAANSPPKFHIIPLSSPSFNFIQISPFSRQPTSSSNPNLRFLMEASKVVREVRNSMASNVEKCLEMLDNLRSQNGVLDKVMSFPSYLQNGFQKLPRRNMRTLGMPSNLNFAAILPGDSVAGIVVSNGILNFLNIYNTLLVVRLVLTWFPNAPPAIVSPLSTLCDPYLNIFRGIIPPLGGLDLSPILAFLILNALTSTASALPAELPSEASNGIQSPATAAHLTASQKKWMKRFPANKSKSSNGAIIQRSSRFSSHDKKILAIALAILAMLSPLYIDRKSIPEPEDDEESMFLSSSYLLPLLQLLLMTAIAISVYLERGFTRLDPYWIHRAGGSSTGIIIILMVLTLVLKCKATQI